MPSLRQSLVLIASLLLAGVAADAGAQRVRARPGKAVKQAPARAKVKKKAVRKTARKPSRKKVSAEAMRRNVGRRAARRVRSGQVVGLGTGRTANEAIKALGRRVKTEGLKITGVPTSERTAELARKHGIPIALPGEVRKVDVAIDGADEVDPDLDLVKGLGGALLREKQVARKADRFIVVVDSDKMVSGLGRGKIPVEVKPKSSRRSTTWLRLVGGSGGSASLRQKDGGGAYVTDNGNYIVDVKLGQRPKKLLRTRDGRKELSRKIERVPGVVDHGLFLDMTSEVLVGREDGSVQEIRR